MEKLHTYKVIVAVILSSWLCGCSKDSFFDFFIGGQPTFVGNHSFSPGLNIFGVIRPDSSGSKSMTLIQIEKVIPAISNNVDSTTVDNLSVVIYKIKNNEILDSISFNYLNPDTIFTHNPKNFSPMQGELFRIICRSPGLPTLTAETVMPNEPVIVDNSLKITSNKVQFSILADTTAFLYDTYLLVNNKQYTQRILRTATGNTMVEISSDEPIGISAQVRVYAYDKKLAEYLTAANLFYKPNTYRPPFTSVQNGYGCFGSLNLLFKNL